MGTEEQKEEWRCKHCGGELENLSFYDEEGVEGMGCTDCERNWLGRDFDEDEMIKVFKP